MLSKLKWIGQVAIATSVFATPVFAEAPIKIGLGGPDELVKSQFACGTSTDTACVICFPATNVFEERVLVITNADKATDKRNVTGLKAYFADTNDEVLFNNDPQFKIAPIVGIKNRFGINSAALDYNFTYQSIPKCHPDPSNTDNDAILTNDNSQCTFGVFTSDSGNNNYAPKTIYIKGHKKDDPTIETTKFYVSVAIGNC